MAMRAIRGVVPAIEEVRSRPSRVVMTAVPLLLLLLLLLPLPLPLPLLLLVMSALIISHHPALSKGVIKVSDALRRQNGRQHHDAMPCAA